MKYKTKNVLKKVLSIGLACVIGVGAIAGISALAKKSDEDTKTIRPSYEIGGLTTTGAYLETDKSIYSDAFECQGLDIELDFRSTVSYQVFFYDYDKNFLSATTALTSNYDEALTPLSACYSRVVVTPISVDDEDISIKWYNKHEYSNQLTITVDKNIEVVKTIEITTLFEFTDGQAVIANTSNEGFGNADTSGNFKASNYVDMSDYVGNTLKITLPIYTSNSGGQASFGLVFYDEEKNPIESGVTVLPLGANSVEEISVEIPLDAKYVRTTYYGSSFVNYDYSGDFYALICF